MILTYDTLKKEVEKVDSNLLNVLSRNSKFLEIENVIKLKVIDRKVCFEIESVPSLISNLIEVNDKWEVNR